MIRSIVQILFMILVIVVIGTIGWIVIDTLVHAFCWVIVMAHDALIRT